MVTFIQQEKAEEELQNFKNIFQEKADKLLKKPIKQRQLNDVCCFIFFLIFFISFVGYAIYSIRSMIELGRLQQITGQKGTIFQGINNDKLKIFATIIFSCLGGAIFVSLILCGFFWICPNIGVMMMALAGSIIVSAIALYLVIATIQVLGKYSAFFFLLALGYIALILSFKKQLQSAAILMKTIKLFIVGNPKIIMLVIISLIYCLIVVCLWCVGFYSFCVRYEQNQISYQAFVGSSIFWGFLLVFFNYYFYYTSVFLTSQSLAIWFYQVEDMDPLATPLKHLVRGHLGTITFGSLILTLINMLKFFFFFGRCSTDESILKYLGKCCSHIVFLCLGALEPLSQVLNSYAIITSALTGQSFVTSARIVGHIAFLDFTSFSNFAVVGYMMRLGSIFFTCSIPTIIAIILLVKLLDNSYLTMVGSVLIIFTTSIIGMVILQIFVESINALFVLYRMDTQIMELGHEITWVEHFGRELDKGFDQASIDHLIKKPKTKYRNITTVVVHNNGATEVHHTRVQISNVNQQQKNQGQASLQGF